MMSYTPTDITFDPWSSPITIDGVDYISDLDDAVNSIITNDPQSLVVFINAQMAKMPPYLSAEMAKMYAEVEDSANEAATYASNAAASESNAATSASNASTAAALSNTYAGNSATSASNAATSEYNAGISETHAHNSEVSSGGSSAASLSSANLAEEWAQKAEDVEVETGLYSAFHWAQKAEDAVGGVDSSGSDANGHWIKFTNGWMIQYGGDNFTVGTAVQNKYGSTSGEMYEGGSNIFMPEAFIDQNFSFAATESSSTGGLVYGYIVADNYLYVKGHHPVDNTVIRVNWIATGQWK